MADVIKDTIDSMTLPELESKDSTSPTGEDPVLDATKVRSIVLRLQEVEKNNGYGGIAMAEMVNMDQVAEIDKARIEKIYALKPVEVIP
jgi:hypothetical protein